MGAADACASKRNVGLGGWWIESDRIDLSQVKWFRLELTMADLPEWLRPQVSAHERIAFFELLPQVVLVFLRLRGRSHVKGGVVFQQKCDNTASVGAVRKYFTTAAPMCFGLQALGMLPRHPQVNVSHVPGEKKSLQT